MLLASIVVVGCGAEEARPARSAEPDPVMAIAVPEPVEAIDDAGRAVRLASPARRIVSLLPAATETLIALGAADLLVGRTDYDDASLAHLPSVGGGLTPSLELLASLQPDLVIAWEEAGGARIRPRLEQLGIAVFAATTSDTAGIFANIERLGHLTGLDDRAARLATEVRTGLADVRASVADRDPKPVLYLIGLDPPMVAGPRMFIGEIVSLAGGRNVFDDATTSTPQVSLEEIVRRRPEVVLIPASGAASMPIERLSTAPGWRLLFESERTRFLTLPPDVLHRAGPGIVSAALRLRDAIYPELVGAP